MVDTKPMVYPIPVVKLMAYWDPLPMVGPVPMVDTKPMGAHTLDGRNTLCLCNFVTMVDFLQMNPIPIEQ